MPSSPSEKTRAALVDIRDNILAVREFTEGNDVHAGSSLDKKTFYAVTRALEIVSEASRRIPDEIKARHPHIDWRSVRDAGNFYRHSYDHVEADLVRETIEKDLPILARMVETELAAAAKPPGDGDQE